MAKGKAADEFDPTAAAEGENFEGSDTSVMVDLSDTEEATFETVPKGVYGVTVESCEYGPSQSSGQPMWSLQLVINEGQYEGRKLFDNLSFSPKALPFTKKKLAIIAPELLNGPFNAEEQAGQIEGRMFKVRTKMAKYDGEDVSRIKDYLADEAAFLTG